MSGISGRDEALELVLEALIASMRTQREVLDVLQGVELSLASQRNAESQPPGIDLPTLTQIVIPTSYRQRRVDPTDST